MAEQQSLQSYEIVQAFRQIYAYMEQNITATLAENTDSTVFARMSDEYRSLLLQVCLFYWSNHT
jgi:hypothetical protein